jgi:hypothetical protein
MLKNHKKMIRLSQKRMIRLSQKWLSKWVKFKMQRRRGNFPGGVG